MIVYFTIPVFKKANPLIIIISTLYSKITSQCLPRFSVGSTTGAVILMVNLDNKDHTPSMVTDEVKPWNTQIFLTLIDHQETLIRHLRVSTWLCLTFSSRVCTPGKVVHLICCWIFSSLSRHSVLSGWMCWRILESKKWTLMKTFTDILSMYNFLSTIIS